ncbi:hypothetical protein SAMN04487818_106343 [Actinokineospora terrae]|uniref:Uncharacterized protein n=1 Tax=Actinokineospora terrae TaxID=155974 RepID=A0A1H9TLU3_9PSEU|nr:hypothetical protein SAMN04487818_106343 [Actinokineospora terrae]
MCAGGPPHAGPAARRRAPRRPYAVAEQLVAAWAASQASRPGLGFPQWTGLPGSCGPRGQWAPCSAHHEQTAPSHPRQPEPTDDHRNRTRRDQPRSTDDRKPRARKSQRPTRQTGGGRSSRGCRGPCRASGGGSGWVSRRSPGRRSWSGSNGGFAWGVCRGCGRSGWDRPRPGGWGLAVLVLYRSPIHHVPHRHPGRPRRTGSFPAVGRVRAGRAPSRAVPGATAPRGRGRRPPGCRRRGWGGGTGWAGGRCCSVGRSRCLPDAFGGAEPD